MVSSGAQDEVRFSCPRTGLTVFRGVLVQVEQPKARSKKNRKSTEKGQSGRIEAVFLVPFGQNNNRAFQLPARRQNLCRMLNVSSLLLIFSNPRYFHSDLDSIKSALSGVLGAFHLGRADGGNAPILSTPDGYTRNKLELSTSTSKQREILTDCVQFRLSDLDQLLNLKRLVLPHADLRPVLATNASSLRVPSVMGPRGLHAQAWVEMLSLPTGCSRVACYGLPPIGPFSSERSRHFQIHLAGANPGCEVSIQEAFNALYTEESGTTVCLQCGIPLITWPAMCSEDQGDEKLDLVLYDPIATNAIAYYHCFTPDSLAVLSDLCTKRLKSQGWLLILCEESEKAPPGPSIPSSLGSFQRVLSYLVPESMFADPGTRVDIFHSDALHVNDARVELLTRLQKHKTGCNEQEETFDEIMDMCNHVETLLIDLVHSA